jgi:hypothetical protein
VLVELGNEGLIRFFLSVQVSTEESSSSLHQRSLLGAYLAGVDLELVGNLRRGLLTSQGCQGHLGLECWAVLLTTLLHLLLLHVSSIILGAGPDLRGCLKSGKIEGTDSEVRVVKWRRKRDTPAI